VKSAEGRSWSAMRRLTPTDRTSPSPFGCYAPPSGRARTIA